MEELCHHQTLEKEAKVWHKVFCKYVFADSMNIPELGIHPDVSKLKALG